MNKLLTAVISFVTFLVILVPYPTFGQASYFYDVSTWNENYTAVQYLLSLGRITGYTDGTFRPNAKMNRASFVGMAVMARGYYANSNYSDYSGNCFEDVNYAWYADKVCYARSQGWLSNLKINDNSRYFKPTAKIKSTEATKIAEDIFGIDDINFDAASKNAITRGEAAQLLYQALIGTSYLGTSYYGFSPYTYSTQPPEGYLGPTGSSSYTPYTAPYYAPVYTPSYVPPTYVPPTYVPPTYVPPTYVPPTYVPPTYVPPAYIPSYVPPTYTPPIYTPPVYTPPGYIIVPLAVSPAVGTTAATAVTTTTASPAIAVVSTTTTEAPVQEVPYSSLLYPNPVDPFTTPWTYGNSVIPPTTGGGTSSCTADVWSCAGWATCSAAGAQARTCNMTFNCSTTDQPARPALTRSCTPPPSCTSDTWSCTSWGTCSAGGTQTRTCTLTYDCPTAQPPRPAESQSCTPSTPPTGDRAAACAAAGITGIPSITPETYGINYCAFDNTGAPVTQALIGQAHLAVVWGAPFDFAIQDSLWAMALAYSSDMFGINPNYLMGLVIKESHADCSYYGGCFQITGGFPEVQTRYPLYIDPSDREDEMVNSFGSASVVTSLYILFGEAQWEHDGFQWSAFYTASPDPETRAKIISRGYNRGLWDIGVHDILVANRAQCITAPDVFACFPAGTPGTINWTARDHAQAVLSYCNSLMQSTNFYDTRLNWIDIQRFITQVPRATFSSISGIVWPDVLTRAQNAFVCLQDSNSTISFRYDFKTFLQSIKTLFPPVPKPLVCWVGGVLTECP